VANADLAFIDSCVLLDVFNDDEHWCDWSTNALYEASQKYRLVINTIVFTEIAFNFSSCKTLQDTLQQLNIDILDIPIDAAFDTSRVFKKYRKRGGDKKTPMPDFYIGAHATNQKALLITREISRYKSYYPQLQLIAP
jgi:predicted nucleic acid-binding protein